MKLLVVLCAVWLVTADDFVGNPRHTKLDVKSFSHSMVQQDAPGDEPDVGGTDNLTDETVVQEKLGHSSVTRENLGTFLLQRGLSTVGLIGELISRTACVIRLEAETGAQVSGTVLEEYLSERDRSADGSKDEKLTRACDYNDKEREVRVQLGKLIGDITTQELKIALTQLGFISTDGSKADLVYRLGKAHLDLATIRRLSGDPNFDTTDVQDFLTTRGISVEGTTGQLLGRLANALIESAESASVGGHHPVCDMVVSSGLCIGGGGKVKGPDARPQHMVGHWTFDDQLHQDSSGYMHNPKAAVGSGPGVFGAGSSAAFDGHQYLEIPHTSNLNPQHGAFCLTMWTYLTEDSTSSWRPIVHKGNQDHERTPTLFLEPFNRGIELFVSTTAANPAGERLWSNTFLPLNKWTHIAACVETNVMRLYINGLLDAENTTIGEVVFNEGPLYLGSDPWRQGESGFSGYIDDFQYYTGALSSDFIMAQAHAAGGHPGYVELGCMGCTYDSCEASCRRGWHVCSQVEMSSYAYTTARGMGWANAMTTTWSQEDRDSDVASTTSGLCVCCPSLV